MLLVEIKHGTTTLENRFAVFKKVNIHPPYDPAIGLSCLPKRKCFHAQTCSIHPTMNVGRREELQRDTRKLLGGHGYAHNLGCGHGLSGLHVCQNLPVFTSNVFSLLYVDYLSRKPFIVFVY